MQTIDDVRIAAKAYLASFDAFLAQYAIEDEVRADHLGYKCASSESFEHLRRVFEGESQFIYQSIISNRRIAIIKLTEPLHTRAGDISYVELSDQKPDGSQVEGFDHLEMYAAFESEAVLIEKLRSLGILLVEDIKPHHTTHNIKILDSFLLKIEAEPLIDKIMREEMR